MPGARAWGTATRAHTGRRRAGPARPPPPAPPRSGPALRGTPRRGRRGRRRPPAGAAARRPPPASPPPHSLPTGPVPTARGERRHRPRGPQAARHVGRGAVAGREHERAGAIPAVANPPRRLEDHRPRITARAEPDHRGAAIEPGDRRPGRRPDAGPGQATLRFSSVGKERTASGDDAVPRNVDTGPAQRHAAHAASWRTAGGGPQPRTAEIGRNVTPGTGSTSSSTTHPATRRGPRAMRTWVPTRHGAGERVGNAVVEGLAQRAHVGNDADDSPHVCFSHGRSVTRRWVAPRSGARARYRPRARLRSSTRGVASQVNSLSERPKCP